MAVFIEVEVRHTVTSIQICLIILKNPILVLAQPVPLQKHVAINGIGYVFLRMDLR